MPQKIQQSQEQEGKPTIHFFPLSPGFEGEVFS